jgi:glycerate 2-kinase
MNASTPPSPASALLRRLFDAAIDSARPERSLPQALADWPDPDVWAATTGGRTIVIGAGKAAASMAQALEAFWAASLGRLEGLIVTRDGYGLPLQRLRLIEASHPVPDARSLAAARQIRQIVTGLRPQDRVLALLSVVVSAFLSCPAPGLNLADKQAVHAALLQSGASIGEMNAVRRQLSAIKGGRLAAACHPAQVLTLLISDVPGDRLLDIASGPTVADPGSAAEARAILARYGLTVPPAVRDLLESGGHDAVRPGDVRLAGHRHRLIAAPQQALEAAASLARAEGWAAHILGDSLEGEARDLGKVLGALTRQIATRSQPFEPPCLLLSGGETTVTVRGGGRGGRNVEFLLSLALSLDGLPGVCALAGDTDGVDGREEIAGAVIGPDTLTRARVAGLNPRQRLDANDAHSFFLALGDSVVTGPTRTNVNDFRAILIGG